MMMNENPRTVSHIRTLLQCLNSPGKTFAKEEPRNVMPRIVLNCAKMTVTAAAEQNPDITGADIKSMTNPIYTVNTFCQR